MPKTPFSLPSTPEGSGPLSVSLLLGHPKYEPLSAKILDLEVPESYASSEHPDEAKFHVMPEIVHTFRPPQKTPPAFVSMLGAALVVSPWVFLIYLVSSIALLSLHREFPVLTLRCLC